MNISETNEAQTYQELKDQNLALQAQLADLKADYQSLWQLLVDVSRRLQISSASVKAAVTSLLNHDIFWDASAQHEFLLTIDDSVDSVSSYAMLISLVSRLRVDKIELRREPQDLQEILSILQNDLTKQIDNLDMEVIFSDQEKPVFVDYEYLMIALRLLFEAFDLQSGDRIGVKLRAKETDTSCLLEVVGVDVAVHEMLCSIVDNATAEFSKGSRMTSERALMVYIAYQICKLQKVELLACLSDNEEMIVRFVIPLSSVG